MQDYLKCNHTESQVSNYFPFNGDISSSSKFRKFAEWSGIPPQYREPETESEFAHSVGVSKEVLDTWKLHPTFSTLVAESMMRWIQEKTPEVIGVLYKKISEDNADGKDFEFFIRLGHSY
jgi:hypothetical protein